MKLDRGGHVLKNTRKYFFIEIKNRFYMLNMPSESNSFVSKVCLNLTEVYIVLVSIASSWRGTRSSAVFLLPLQDKEEHCFTSSAEPRRGAVRSPGSPGNSPGFEPIFLGLNPGSILAVGFKQFCLSLSLLICKLFVVPPLLLGLCADWTQQSKTERRYLMGKCEFRAEWG